MIHYKKRDTRISACGWSGTAIRLTEKADEVECQRCLQILGDDRYKNKREKIIGKKRDLIK